MKIYPIIKPWLRDIYNQLFTTSSKRSGKLRLTHLTFTRMQEYGLREADIENAFRFGKEVKDGMLIQRFQKYQVGLTYKEGEKQGEYVIITCWKR